MTRYNPKNERIKRDYLDFRRYSEGKDEKSIEPIRSAISMYEAHTNFADLATFNRFRAMAFRERLAEAPSGRTGKPLRAATQVSVLRHLQHFFAWLSQKPGYKRRLIKTDIDYLKASDNDIRRARASAPPEYPSVAQIRAVVAKMPSTTDIERRNRALIAFVALTGIRDSALISLKLKHYDMATGWVRQDPNEVATKRAKEINTHLFPVGDELVEIVNAWLRYLYDDRLFSPTDPMFPKTQRGQDSEGLLAVCGLSREHWLTTQGVRGIFKDAFQAAGMKYYYPHTFRHTLTHLGQQVCETPEQFKAWSQNLGHEKVMTTFSSYGHVSHHRQGEIIKGLGKPASGKPDLDASLEALLRQLQATVARKAGASEDYSGPVSQ